MIVRLLGQNHLQNRTVKREHHRDREVRLNDALDGLHPGVGEDGRDLRIRMTDHAHFEGLKELLNLHTPVVSDKVAGRLLEIQRQTVPVQAFRSVELTELVIDFFDGVKDAIGIFAGAVTNGVAESGDSNGMLNFLLRNANMFSVVKVITSFSLG